MIPNRLEAQFRIVTPMFLGGANQDTRDGIRPPSVKGALRFWWRALNWGRFRCGTENDATALRQLHDEEARLFGMAGQEEGRGGQGCFLLRTTHSQLAGSRKDEVHSKLKEKPGARYLGYGLMEAFPSGPKGTKAGQLIRPCVTEGQEFRVELIFRQQLDNSIIEALIAWGLLGGLGSRVRHGYGSIALLSLRKDFSKDADAFWTAPTNVDAYEKAIRELLKTINLPDGLSPFSAISRRTRCDILLDEQTTPYDVLNAFGNNLSLYRSWGNNGKVFGQDAERNFQKDHDWSKGDRPEGFHPRRIIFGLPHNYGKTANMQIKPANHERRASPLLFHVHWVEQAYLGVTLLLPSLFLPPDEQIDAGGEMVMSNPDWTVITDFLDGKAKGDGKPRFPLKRRVLGASQ